MIPRRALHSYSKEVLIEWIERRGISYFQEELDGIERRMSEPTPPPDLSCAKCQDAGVIFSGSRKEARAAWCQCSAAGKMKLKVPEFVEVWNEHQLSGQWKQHVNRMQDLQQAGTVHVEVP